MADWFLLLSGAAVLLGTTRFMLPFLKNRQQCTRSQQDFGSDNIRRRVPLKEVVARCEARWFLEDLQRAMDGDAGAMIRVGHMLLAGYGVKQDKQEAGKWLQQVWAIQNYQNLVGVEIMDMDDSVVPNLSWVDGHDRKAAKTRSEGAGERHKSVAEIYDIMEETMREQSVVDDEFTKDVNMQLLRHQWRESAAAAAEQRQISART